MAFETNPAWGHWTDASISDEESLSRLLEALPKQRFGIITTSGAVR